VLFARPRALRPPLEVAQTRLARADRSPAWAWKQKTGMMVPQVCTSAGTAAIGCARPLRTRTCKAGAAHIRRMPRTIQES
jgi:hypothetical protein